MRREFVLARGGRWPADAQMRMMGMSTRELSSYVGRDLGVGLSPKAVAAAVIKGIRERDALQSAPDRGGGGGGAPASRGVPTQPG